MNNYNMDVTLESDKVYVTIQKKDKTKQYELRLADLINLLEANSITSKEFDL